MPNTPSVDAIRFEVDSLGPRVVLSIDTKVYPEVAIFKTAYWYTDNYYIYLAVSLDRPQYLLVEFREKELNAATDLEAVARTFVNALLDQTVRQRVMEETNSVREQLIQRAFGEGLSHADPDNLGDDQSRIPVNGQSWEDDPKNISAATGSDER